MSPSSRPSRAALEELKKAQQAKERRTRIAWIAGITAVVLVIGGIVGFTVYQDVSNRPTLADVQTFDGLTANHVQTTVQYAQTPPVGGDHNAVWLNCGVYTSPVPNENAVHSMEHGAVWVTYRPDLPADQVERLVDELPSEYIVVSPYDGLPAPVVASAWGHQLQLTGVDDPRLAEFVREYREGPQTPEPGAACTGGTNGSDGLGVPVPSGSASPAPSGSPSASPTPSATSSS